MGGPLPTWQGGYVAQPRPVTALPPFSDHFRQRGHTLLVALVWLTAVLGLVGAVFLSITAGGAEGSGLVLLYALLPVPFLVGSYFWLDRYEPEPMRYKIAAIVWGGVVAVAIALAAQLVIQHGWHVSDKHMATFVAPLTEEPAKCLFLLLTFARSRRVLDGFVDGLVYAGLVGLGFAFVENVGYYAGSYVGGPDIQLAGARGATMTFVVRGVFSPFAHPLFTSAFGIALGFALLVRSRLLRVLVGATGLLGSVLLHGAWNGSLSYGGPTGFLVTYVALGALFTGLVVAACIARMRQGHYLLRALSDTANRGWIHPDEVPYLARLPYRKTARAFAKQRVGPLAERAFVRYQQDAVAMGFLYGAVMDGRPKPDAVPRVFALLDDMRRVKPFVRLPPPVRRAMPPRPPAPPVPSLPYYPPPPYRG